MMVLGGDGDAVDDCLAEEVIDKGMEASTDLVELSELVSLTFPYHQGFGHQEHFHQ